MKQITVTLKDQPGSLANVCDLLGKNGVNIVTLYGGNGGQESFVHLVTEDDRTAEHVLQKAGFKTSSCDIITTKMLDRPGELAKATYRLAHAGVNIESIYLLTLDRGEVTLALCVNDEKKAQGALS